MGSSMPKQPLINASPRMSKKCYINSSLSNFSTIHEIPTWSVVRILNALQPCTGVSFLSQKLQSTDCSCFTVHHVQHMNIMCPCASTDSSASFLFFFFFLTLSFSLVCTFWVGEGGGQTCKLLQCPIRFVWFTLKPGLMKNVGAYLS